MIKVLEKCKEVKEKIEFDSYSPFQIELSSHTLGLDPVFHWRATGNDYLLDFGIHSKTAELVSINLTLVPNKWVITDKLVSFSGKPVLGLPICDIKPWLDRIGPKEFGIDEALFTIDSEMKFKLSVTESICQVIVSEQEPVRFFVNERVHIGISESNEICFIELGQLSTTEVENLALSVGLKEVPAK